MIHLRDRFGFAAEAFDQALVARHLAEQELDGAGAAAAHVAAIDAAGPADAEQVVEGVLVELQTAEDRGSAELLAVDAAVLRIHRVDGETVRTGPHPKTSISLGGERLVGWLERQEQLAEARGVRPL